MELISVGDCAFAPYGRLLVEYDFTRLLEHLKDCACPAEKTLYLPRVPALEALPDAAFLRNSLYGSMDIQIGCCNGFNRVLNCLEYHRGSEVLIADNDVVLLLAHSWQIQDWTLDTGLVKGFFLPAGTAVQLYETTLHYAPCNAPGQSEFRVAVVLPGGTNADRPPIQARAPEDRLLFARNKWMLAHPDSPEARQGAHVGLTGANITI